MPWMLSAAGACLLIPALLPISARAGLPAGCSITSASSIECINPNVALAALTAADKVTVNFPQAGAGFRWAPLTDQMLGVKSPVFFGGCGAKCGPDFKGGDTTYYQNIDGAGFSCGVGMDFDYQINFLGMDFGLHVDDWQLSGGLVYQTEAQGGGAAGLRAFLVGELSKGNPHILAQPVPITENQTQVFTWVTIVPIGVEVMNVGVTLTQLQASLTLPDLKVTNQGIYSDLEVQTNIRLQGLCVDLGWLGSHCALSSPAWPVSNMIKASIGLVTESLKCYETKEHQFFDCEFDVALLRWPVVSVKVELASGAYEAWVTGSIAFDGSVLASFGPFPVSNLPWCFGCGASSDCSFQVCLASVEDAQGQVLPQLGIILKETKSGEVVGRFTHHSLAYTSSSYSEYLNKNCWSDHGAVQIDTDDTAPVLADGNACQSRCDYDPKCDCATFSVHPTPGKPAYKCWKEHSCILSNCTEDGNFMVYVKPNTYDSHAGRNCYNGHGAVSIDDEWSAITGIDAAACQRRCDANALCDCVTYSVSVDGATPASRCWMESHCQLDKCAVDDHFIVFVKQRSALHHLGHMGGIFV